MNNLRVVYMGTPDFAVSPLSALLDSGVNIVGVVTNPDKPAGRGQKMSSSPVKQFAEENGLPILQPEKFRDTQFLESLRAWEADLQIVVAFKMLPEVVWDMPRLGTVNLHASLLPNYRGAAPINHSIINGETETGVTTFLLQKEIDTGHIILQERISIAPDETAGSLHDKLMEEGAKLLVKTVIKIQAGDYELLPQEETATLHLAPKIFKSDCEINWSLEGMKIYKHIMGLSPYPTAWTTVVVREKAVTLKIFLCNFEKTEVQKYEIGQLLTDDRTFLKVAVIDGFISIREVQLAGKKRLSIEDFLRGFDVSDARLV